ncbi:MAG: hypothetical protein J7L44_03900 [Candidatus Diapherotrites archaeon]|nr:hypothetical protein [Candidatus Diapherotrites archaeon]
MYNKYDRLHRASKTLCKDKGPDVLFLSTVLAETKTTFLKRYNQALSRIQAIIHSAKSQGDAQRQLNRLLERPSRLINFYKLIINQLRGDFSAPNIVKLRSNAIKAINNLEVLLEESLGIKLPRYTPSQEPSEEQKAFLNKVASLSFSDSWDKRIFIEFVYVSFETSLEEFYSNDKRFINQARRNYKELKVKKLQFYHLREKETKPFYQIK